MEWAVLAALAVMGVCLLVVLWWRRRRAAGAAAACLEELESDDDELFGLKRDDEGFVLEADGPASFSERRLELRGRLQLYVRSGSQYATWRQFPQAMRYEIETPAGDVALSNDLTLSISDTQESYERYAAEPADQVVGVSFEVSVFDQLSRLIEGPGRYRLRAHYLGSVSAWTVVDVEP